MINLLYDLLHKIRWKRTRSCEQRKNKVSSCNRETVRIKEIKNFGITNARRISWVLSLEVYWLHQSTQLCWYLCLYLVQQLTCRHHYSHSYHQHYYFHFLIGYFGILPGPEVHYKNNLGYEVWAGKLLNMDRRLDPRILPLLNPCH